MPRRQLLPHERLRVYRVQNVAMRCLCTIMRELPPEQDQVNQWLGHGTMNMGIKMIRGFHQWRRAEARAAFKDARRGAELCESVLLGLHQHNIGRELQRQRGLQLLKQVLAGLDEIIARVDAGMCKRDVFRGV